MPVSERQATGESTFAGFVLGIIGLCLAASGGIAGRALNTGAALPWFLLAPLQVTGATVVAWVGVVATRAPVDAAALVANAVPFAYLALGMTAGRYFAYNFVLSRLPTPTIGLVSAGGPGVGAVAAAVIFGTTIGPIEVFGIVIILFGTALAALWVLRTRRRGRRGCC